MNPQVNDHPLSNQIDWKLLRKADAIAQLIRSVCNAKSRFLRENDAAVTSQTRGNGGQMIPLLAVPRAPADQATARPDARRNP
jgi:hypothetical protein